DYIANSIGVHKSTISRELKRNADKRSGDYRAKLAERKCRERHANKPKKVYLSEDMKEVIESLIKEDYSPEQVVGYCRKNGLDCVSTERIYLHIWKDKKNKGILYKHLRRKGRKYKKRGSITNGRGQIPDRVSIDKRPPEVDNKIEFGDLEADTIVGKDHKGAIVTLNDRASGMLKMKKTKTREAKEIRMAINQMLEEWVPYINTITADNGKEFAEHQKIAESCQIDFYFANPYSPWERGANENLNGLIRQYFPKKTDFSNITDQEVERIERKLNNRPRKRLKFETPLEVMDKLLFKTEVAFMT
ncbi:IS30 family transposase, partial [Winogradskyella sp.]|uniref:IS30 family transposase n=1 Tax=Winogradskyella sp. TaxID=1883156 RepID=UPI0025FE263E